MIRKLILIITLSVLLSANLDMKVKDLLGNSDYNTHKNLINHIFSNEANFYTKGVLAIAFENPKIEPEGIVAMWMVINKSSFQDEKVASAKPNFGN